MVHTATGSPTSPSAGTARSRGAPCSRLASARSRFLARIGASARTRRAASCSPPAPASRRAGCSPERRSSTSPPPSSRRPASPCRPECPCVERRRIALRSLVERPWVGLPPTVAQALREFDVHRRVPRRIHAIQDQPHPGRRRNERPEGSAQPDLQSAMGVARHARLHHGVVRKGIDADRAPLRFRSSAAESGERAGGGRVRVCGLR